MNNKRLLVCVTLIMFGTALIVIQFSEQNAQAVEVKETIVNEQIKLPAGKSTYFPFTIPQGASDVHLSGKTEVVGGIIPRILIGLYNAKDCPKTGTTVYFLNCKPFKQGYFDDKNSFGFYIPSGQYYILFKNDAYLGENKIITPTVTVTYNK